MIVTKKSNNNNKNKGMAGWKTSMLSLITLLWTILKKAYQFHLFKVSNRNTRTRC